MSVDRSSIKKIPSSTGIYLFKKNRQILYIGKSINLKARLLSHLENAKLDPKEAAIINGSNSVEYIVTDSEFKALLLESSLIQKHRPKYNSRWRDDKSYLYIKITVKDSYPKVFSVRRENDGQSSYFGPFPSQKDVDMILRTTRKIFPFCTQQKISKKPCFYSKIGLCQPCPNFIDNLANLKEKTKLRNQYRRNIRQLILVLHGKVELVLRNSYQLIKQYGADQNYEEALNLRNKIQQFESLIYQKQFSSDISTHYNTSSQSLRQLQHILGLTVQLQRIECYDISNLFQKDATASMVVFSDGQPDKSQYRRFKIKNPSLNSDLEMLEEVFSRRFRQKWPLPNLVVVDGGTPQVLKTKQVLMLVHQSTPLVGIAKHPDRLVLDLPDGLKTIRPSANNLGFNLVQAIRDESHRFAKKYHLLLRHKRLML